MRVRRRPAILAAALAAGSSIASGYYHYTFFANHTGPFQPVSAKFDLNALPNKTVSYFISDQGPAVLMPGDSLTALVSQIRLAAETWNDVATSDLRVRFGGFSSSAVPQSSPGIDVVFDDNMPPGLLAQTRAITSDDLSGVAGGAAFVPIVRSRLQLHRDLTVNQQASYSDAFFTTLVHEFGHALGLQHTLTSSAMSTAVTRATTKSKPLTADDVAGVSVLYPAAGFATSTGTITGRVTLAGGGVNLASVQALSPSGGAVSAMTNPDGSYRIDGVPPGLYYVYVQPLPPPQQGEASPANVVAPLDPQKNPFPANTGFDGQFFTGTHDWTQSPLVPVNVGASTDNINFNVQRRNGPAVYGMETFAYQGAGGQIPVASPYLVSGSRITMVFYAPGTVVNGNQVAPGLNVSVLNGPAVVEAGSVRYWRDGFLQMTVSASIANSATAVSLAVTLNNDLYVLPAAFFVTPTAAPTVSAVLGSADNLGGATATVFGSNLTADTRILFDGAPGTVVQANADGSLTVAAPPAPALYRAWVEALAPDGQTSWQALGTALPASFTYQTADNPSFGINPTFVAAGSDTSVEVNLFAAAALDPGAALGFGTSDVQVRRSWVTSRSRMLLNLSVLSSAVPGSTTLTLANGLQLMTLNTILQIQPPSQRQISMKVPVTNRVTGLAGVPVGGVAVINTTGLPPNLPNWTVTVGDQRAAFAQNGSQLLVQVPAGLAIGPAIVKLNSPTGEYVPPVAMQVDAPPPVVVSALLGADAVDVNHMARAGDLITLIVNGLSDGITPVNTSTVRINVAGVEQVPSGLFAQAQAGVFAVLFQLAPNTPFGPQQPLTVTIDTRQSAPVAIAIRN